MKRLVVVTTLAIAAAPAIPAQQPASDGPYKVLMRAKVGGEGGTDYIHALGGRPAVHHAQRGARRRGDGQHAGAGCRRRPRDRLRSRDAQAARRDRERRRQRRRRRRRRPGHGFASSHPNLSMFDTKSMQMIKTIDPNADNAAANPKFSADGIYFDPSDEPRLHRQPPDEGSDRPRLARRQGRSARSISAACRSRRSPTARARCTPCCRIRRAASRSSTRRR